LLCTDPAQVLIRFVNIVLGTERYPLAVTLLVAVLLPTAALLLAASAPWIFGAVIFALMLGFASGLKSIVQGCLFQVLEEFCPKIGTFVNLRCCWQGSANMLNEVELGVQKELGRKSGSRPEKPPGRHMGPCIVDSIDCNGIAGPEIPEG
jgi:hypothetical protein